MLIDSPYIISNWNSLPEIITTFQSLKCFKSDTCISTLTSITADYYMDEHCGRTIDMSVERFETAKVKTTRHGDYRHNMNCVMKVKAPIGKQIMIYFTKIDIKEKSFRIGYSCEDYLEMFDGNGASGSVRRVSGIILHYVTHSLKKTLLPFNNNW